MPLYPPHCWILKKLKCFLQMMKCCSLEVVQLEEVEVVAEVEHHHRRVWMRLEEEEEVLNADDGFVVEESWV